jgi:Mg-chelatase subunit ChlD
MRLFFPLLVLFYGFVFAQETSDSHLKKEPEVTHFVVTKERVTKNMIFLFDCSTSMGRADRFRIALSEIDTILKQPLDDGMFSLIAFKDDVASLKMWPGIKEEDDPKPAPKGWAKLPSAIAATSANKFLNNIFCDGFTDIGIAITQAFILNANQEELTIILFTDGNNTYPRFNGKKPSEVVALINLLQKSRIDRKKDKIKIFVFGVSVEQNVAMLSAIAKAGGGGYLTTYKVCEICSKNTEDVPEVQRVHRAKHVSVDDPDNDGYLDPDNQR